MTSLETVCLILYVCGFYFVAVFRFLQQFNFKLVLRLPAETNFKIYKDLNRHFYREVMQWPNNHMKKMFGIISYQGNADQTNSEIAFYMIAITKGK